MRTSGSTGIGSPAPGTVVAGADVAGSDVDGADVGGVEGSGTVVDAPGDADLTTAPRDDTPDSAVHAASNVAAASPTTSAAGRRVTGSRSRSWSRAG